jgi:hypothetical protein
VDGAYPRGMLAHRASPIRTLPLWVLAASIAGCSQQPSTVPPPPPPRDLTQLIMSGRVTEPATGLPIEGASVCWSGSEKAHCGVTAQDGTYSFTTELADFSNLSNVRLAPGVSKAGYEHRQSFVPYDYSGTMRWSPGLQRTLRIAAGESISTTVFPAEGSGILDTGEECDACKRLLVTVATNGTLTIRLTSDDSRLTLKLPYVQNASVGAPIPVQGGAEILVLVTGAVEAARFDLSTTFSAAAAR